MGSSVCPTRDPPPGRTIFSASLNHRQSAPPPRSPNWRHLPNPPIAALHVTPSPCLRPSSSAAPLCRLDRSGCTSPRPTRPPPSTTAIRSPMEFGAPDAWAAAGEGRPCVPCAAALSLSHTSATIIPLPVPAAIHRFVSHDASRPTLPLPMTASINGGAQSGVMAP